MTPDSRGALERRIAEDRFRHLYAAHVREVLAYALRRTADAQDAADVVAETRPWLYGVARRTLANQRRGEQRRHRLAERLRADLAAVASHPTGGAYDERFHSALETLNPDDREILRLSAWEELSPSEAARVLGISAIAARSRLHRARRRFARALTEGRRELSANTNLELKEER